MLSCYSDISGGPRWINLNLRVSVGWISKLTISVLGVEGSSSGIGNSDEVVDGLLVSEVLVEVVLEVLKNIHVLLNESVSSDSGEGESVVIQLPSVNANLWVGTLLLQLVVDKHGLLIVFWVEVSGEVIQLNIELLLRNIDSWLAVWWDGWSRAEGELNTANGSHKGQGND